VRRRAILLVVSMALVSLLLSGVATAHPLNFESDLTEEGLVNFCNPDQVKPGLFEQAIWDWNSYAADGSLPRVVDVTGNEGAFCELRADVQGGDEADYVARVVFNRHPDNLDISARFNDLPVTQRGATLRHELGHAVVGLGHNEMCRSSIMATILFCRNNDTPRITTVGPHDVADRAEYWSGTTPIYPIHDKCWTNEDADGDGVCDRYGPRPGMDVDGSPTRLQASSLGGQRVWVSPAIED
jgi:hypothetical protein